MDSRSAVGEDPARGRVRHLKGFRVEVNGRVYARLAANKTSITLKKCKSGMKYTCVVVAMTCPEQSDGHQRKVRRTESLISSQAQMTSSFLLKERIRSLTSSRVFGLFASLMMESVVVPLVP